MEEGRGNSGSRFMVNGEWLIVKSEGERKKQEWKRFVI